LQIRAQAPHSLRIQVSLPESALRERAMRHVTISVTNVNGNVTGYFLIAWQDRSRHQVKRAQGAQITKSPCTGAITARAASDSVAQFSEDI
jgi:hypothetical protein